LQHESSGGSRESGTIDATAGRGKPDEALRVEPSRVSFRSAQRLEETAMCRNIKTLANFEPPATDEEIRASALQFVRKLSGSTHPSHVNEAAFRQAVDEVTATARRLLDSIETRAAPRNREEEARKARERARKRYA
jgi:hypothetical protein